MKMLNLNKNRKTSTYIVKVMSFAILMITLFVGSELFAKTYYSKAGATDANSKNSWCTDRLGNTTYPGTVFGSDNDVYIIQNGHTLTTSNSLSVNGNNLTIRIENGGTLIGSHSINLKSNTQFEIQAGGTYRHNNTGNPFSGGILDGIENFSINSNFVIMKWSSVNLASGIPFSNLEVEFNPSNSNKFNIPAYTFNNLTIHNANGISLTGNVTVSNLLTLTSGLVYTNTYSMIFASTALDPIEITAGRIIGNSVMQSRVIDQNEYTFLGATFGQTTQSLGAVTMTRVTGPTAVSNNSISCKWNIEAAVPPAQGRQMTYKWLSIYDNGRSFSDNNKAQVYFSTDNGVVWNSLGDMVNPVVNGSDVRQISIVTTHYSIWSVGAQNSPLPVTLSSFTSSVKLNNVTLNWATTSEVNNKGFDIERTEVGSNNYTKVGFVDGKGTTNNVTNYTYTDTKLNAGKYSYRIKQVDFNGNFEYFSLSSGIEIGAPKKFTLSQNYPNPFNPSTKIDYEIPADSKVNITIYDISGKEVQQVVNENQKAGYYTAQFNASRLSSGTYFYKLTVNGANGSEVLTKKMTLVK